MAKREKVLVSERAILARINRKLAKDQEVLRKCRRDNRSYHQLGDYYRIDVRCNGVVEMDVPLETIAKDLEVLKPWEEIAFEE
jgi:hypothetical protein